MVKKISKTENFFKKSENVLNKTIRNLLKEYKEEKGQEK